MNLLINFSAHFQKKPIDTRKSCLNYEILMNFCDSDEVVMTKVSAIIGDGDDG